MNTNSKKPSESNPLEQTLRGLIAYEGQITFERFMRLALYHPSLGYYRKKNHPVGKSGDYVTAPEVSSAFASCLARAVAQYWETLGKPPQFDLVELGAGKGTLALGIMGYIAHHSPELYQSMRYTLVEQHVGVRAAFQASEKYQHGGIFRFMSLRDIPSSAFTGCMIANEFFDAFSTHRIQQDHDLLREVYVKIGKDGDFCEELGRPIYPVEPCWQAYGVALKDTQQAECSTRAKEAFGQMASALKRGFMLTIDYGDNAERLYTPERFDGTVMTYKNHQADTSYYTDIGDKDITAHVNFTMFKKCGEELGLRTIGYMPQSKFLLENGIMDFSPEGDDIASQNARQQIKRLLMPAGFGENFKVLVQQK